MKQDEDIQLMRILQGLGGRMIWTGAAGTALATVAAATAPGSSAAPLETRSPARSPARE